MQLKRGSKTFQNHIVKKYCNVFRPVGGSKEALSKAADPPIKSMELQGTLVIQVNFNVSVTTPAGKPVPTDVETANKIEQSILDNFDLDNHQIIDVTASNVCLKCIA